MENNRDEKQSLESPSAVKLKEFSKIALRTASEIACFFAGGVIGQKITGNHGEGVDFVRAAFVAATTIGGIKIFERFLNRQETRQMAAFNSNQEIAIKQKKQKNKALKAHRR